MTYDMGRGKRFTPVHEEWIWKTSRAYRRMHIHILLLYPIRLLVEQRASTMLRQRTLLAAVFSASFQLMFAFFIPSSTDLLKVLAGLPTFHLPCGFHFKACLVVSVLVFVAYVLSKPISVLLSPLVCALVLSYSKALCCLSFLASES